MVAKLRKRPFARQLADRRDSTLKTVQSCRITCHTINVAQERVDNGFCDRMTGALRCRLAMPGCRVAGPTLSGRPHPKSRGAERQCLHFAHRNKGRRHQRRTIRTQRQLDVEAIAAGFRDNFLFVCVCFLISALPMVWLMARRLDRARAGM